MPDDNGHTERPLQVFYSYAHEDRKFCRMLATHLKHLVRQGAIEDWDDRKIRTGDQWHPVIQEKLDQADVVFFLVSPDWFASDYIILKELGPVLERRKRGDNVRVIGLVVRPYSIRIINDVFGGRLVMPLDDRGEPVPVVKWRPQDAAFEQVLEEVAKLVDERVSPQVPGKWVNVPDRGPDFVGRDALLRRVCTEFEACRDRPVVALVAGGGMGKTAVAVEYCWTRRQDYDRVAWLEAEQDAPLEGGYAEAAESFAGFPASDQAAARTAFKDWLAENDRWLLVFDNAVDPDAIRRLLPATTRGHVLITSRETGSRKTRWSDFARVVRVEPLAHDQAVDYLLNATGSRDTAAADELATITRGVPLALKEAAASVREQGITLAEQVRLTRDQAEPTA